METLAYMHLSTTYENPTPEPCQLKVFEDFNWKLPSSAWIRVLSLVLALSVLSAATNAFAYGTLLHRGNRGSQVVTLQNRLKSAGYFPKTVRSTGFYGSITETAVRKFQRAKGLPVDGVAGQKTLSALGSPSGSSGSSGSTLPTNTGLRRGNRGSAVTQLQNRLRALGFFNGPVTGYYGQLTEGAVSRFQRARGLPANGIANSATLAALQNTNGTTPSTPIARELRSGSSGSAVSQLQTRLRALRFYNGEITGYYGQLTELAVRNFQQSRGITVNGIAGRTTLAALQNTSPNRGGSTTIASLQQGSRGTRVRSLQARLKGLGYYQGSIDGIFASSTEAALKRFQQDKGLAASGIADKSTFAALGTTVQLASRF
ncbi:MAG TPA: peptidoglycan-binding protein [Coleofasciculaceae cyanobacterium]